MPTVLLNLVGWAIDKWGTRATAITAFIAIMVALSTSLAVGLGGLLTGLSALAVTPPEFDLGIGLLPSNTPYCVSAVLTARVARWIYDMNVKFLSEVYLTALTR